MSDVILIGDDPDDLEARLNERSLTVTMLDGRPIGTDLDAAGIDEATVLLLTDTQNASIIPVAHERNDRILIALYSTDRLPDFVSAQADLSVDPALIDPDSFVEAIVDHVGATR